MTSFRTRLLFRIINLIWEQKEYLVSQAQSNVSYGTYKRKRLISWNHQTDDSHCYMIIWGHRPKAWACIVNFEKFHHNHHATVRADSREPDGSKKSCWIRLSLCKMLMKIIVVLLHTVFRKQNRYLDWTCATLRIICSYKILTNFRPLSPDL